MTREWRHAAQRPVAWVRSRASSKVGRSNAGTSSSCGGGEGGIRTHEVLRLCAFQERRLQPLGHLSKCDEDTSGAGGAGCADRARWARRSRVTPIPGVAPRVGGCARVRAGSARVRHGARRIRGNFRHLLNQSNTRRTILASFPARREGGNGCRGIGAGRRTSEYGLRSRSSNAAHLAEQMASTGNESGTPPRARRAVRRGEN